MIPDGSSSPTPTIPGLDPGMSAALAQAMQQQSVNAGGGSSYPGLVYLGQRKPVRAEGIGYISPPGGLYNWVSGEEAEHQYNDWSQKKRSDFIAQAKIGGLLDPDAGEAEGANLWRQLVKEASYFGVTQKNRIGPWDILASYVKGKGGASAVWQKDPSNNDFEVNRLTGERRYVGPRFKTTTDQRVDFSDPATASAIATRAFQDLMGRDPGKGELGAFADALHSAEANSPVMSTTTTEYDPTTGEPVGQNTTSSGGLGDAGRQYLAEQKVKGTKEYGVVQAVTNYQNALENLIWGAPDMGGGQ